MIETINSMADLDKAFFYIAFAATLIFVGQILITLIGGDAEVDAIKNIKIDKIVVWDGMGGNGGGSGSTTGDFIQSLLKSLPAYDELFKMTGNKLPQMLDTTPTTVVDAEATDISEGKGKEGKDGKKA